MGAIITIAALVLAIFTAELIVVLRKKESFLSPITMVLLGLSLLFTVVLNYRGSELTGGDWTQMILMIGLVSLTAFYAISTEKQAKASVKMAKEMREQRILSSRPMIFQRAVEEKNIYEGSTSEKYSHFEIYNAGNGTAVDVQVCLRDQSKKNPINGGERRGFLSPNEPPMEFYATLPANEQSPTFYVVTEYQDIYCNVYQTWMPCKLSVTNKIIPGKLEFLDNIPESERTGLFNTSFDKVEGKSQ
jgi:hypothetical protein